MKKKLLGERWVKGCKERGEWVELCFMAKAAGMGMLVSKPLGDSCRYDVLVEAGGRILRVQVKSTIYRRRGNEYSRNVMGPGRKVIQGRIGGLLCCVSDSSGCVVHHSVRSSGQEVDIAFRSGRQVSEVCEVSRGLASAAGE